MGNKLPKHQATIERIKMCPIKATLHLKSFTHKDLPSHQTLSWTEASIILHQSILHFSNTSQKPIPLDNNFLILSQNQSTFELFFLLLPQDQIFIFKCSTLRQFKDIALALFVSKRPSWSRSPTCQLCFKSFTTFTRDHHCRNCGQNICKACSGFSALEISGYLKKQRVCIGCLGSVKVLAQIVKEIQTHYLKVSGNEGLYFFGDCESVLAPSLRG